jgi:hypothetical protein
MDTWGLETIESSVESSLNQLRAEQNKNAACLLNEDDSIVITVDLSNVADPSTGPGEAQDNSHDNTAIFYDGNE